MVNLGQIFPNFNADTTIGKIKFHEWIGASWAMLFSYPADCTPVCTTELGRAAKLAPEFEKRGVKLIALSCDDVLSHKKWTEEILTYAKLKDNNFPFPLVADEKREISVALGIIDADNKDKNGCYSTCKAVFIISPDKRLKLSMRYPATMGQNFDEIVRTIDSLQEIECHTVSTPVDLQEIDYLKNALAKADNELSKEKEKNSKMMSHIEYLEQTKEAELHSKDLEFKSELLSKSMEINEASQKITSLEIDSCQMKTKVENLEAENKLFKEDLSKLQTLIAQLNAEAFKRGPPYPSPPPFPVESQRISEASTSTSQIESDERVGAEPHQSHQSGHICEGCHQIILCESTHMCVVENF